MFTKGRGLKISFMYILYKLWPNSRVLKLSATFFNIFCKHLFHLTIYVMALFNEYVILLYKIDSYPIIYYYIIYNLI